MPGDGAAVVAVLDRELVAREVGARDLRRRRGEQGGQALAQRRVEPVRVDVDRLLLDTGEAAALLER